MVSAVNRSNTQPYLQWVACVRAGDTKENGEQSEKKQGKRPAA
jgi:hypothetical protein